jgi:GNAT superfamily N-acetyltransferase
MQGVRLQLPRRYEMFASTALGARIEAAEARLTASIGQHLLVTRPELDVVVQRLGNGVAVFAGPSSPMNKLIGVGFGERPADDELTSIEDAFRARNAPLQAEVSALASPEFVARLSARGYQLKGFENVHGRAIRTPDNTQPRGPINITLMRDDERDRWVDASITSFLDGDTEGAQADELPPREALEGPINDVMDVPGFQRYCAWIDGQLVGTATLRLDDGLAQLCGAATLPAWRRRGVQTALLQRRLADAAAAGCEIALITTSPGTKSQENGLKQGFALLYVRGLLVKPPGA